MAGITSAGIGSGMDIDGLVNNLVAFESKSQADRLNFQEARIQSQQLAWGTVKTALADFKKNLSNINQLKNYTNRSVSSSNKDLINVSATSTAHPGNYNIEVKQLAQAQKLASANFTSKTTVVGTGTLTFTFGTYDSNLNTFTVNPEKGIKAVTINAQQNTLQGIRDAINEASVGVTASILNDGAGERLILTSNDAGLANSIKLTVTDDDGNHIDDSGLSKLAYDPTATIGSGKQLSQTVAAQNSQVVVDGLTINSNKNTVENAIEGVTLELKKAEVGTIFNVKVEVDKASIKAQVNTFVVNFNALIEAVRTVSKYDAATKKSSTLTGDSALRGLETQIRRVLLDTVPGLDTGKRALSEIGIKTLADGKLSLDNSKLEKAIESDDLSIARLFTEIGEADDGLIKFDSASEHTDIGSYRIQVSQLATQGTLTGSQATQLTITAGVNDTLNVTIDGVGAQITLSAGTYTADALVSQLQARLNGSTTLTDAGIKANVSQSSGVLTIQSARYGSSSIVQLAGGNGVASLFGATPTGVAGVNAAGTIGGLAAQGSGRFLVGTGAASELKIEITGGAIGDRGEISFTRGIAEILLPIVDDYLENKGVLDAKTKAAESRLKDINSQREILEKRIEKRRATLKAQFTSMDGIVSRLRATSDYLGQQMSALQQGRK